MIEQPPSGQMPPNLTPWPAYAPQPRPTARASVVQSVVTSLLVIFAFAAGWFGNTLVKPATTTVNSDRYAQQILDAYNIISDQYVDTSAIDHKKMAYAAIDAMVTSLGDTGHSRFETPDEVKAENQFLQNVPTVGVGIFISGGGAKPLRIDEVIPGSPADGHLKAGDIITAVDGKDVTGQTIDQVRPQIIGKQDTSVVLTVQRAGESAPRDIKLTREPFSVPLVATYVIPGVNLAYIQLTQFAENSQDSSNSTDALLRVALRRSDVQHAAGIILDLRENPGGLLDQAVSVASEFVPAGSGHNVYIQRSRTSRTPAPVVAGGLATRAPLAIIVNGDTASAAEIVAGAVAYNRPTVHIIGEHTFGTDTLLTPITLSDGSVLLLGTNGWLTPDGKNIRATGIVPDQPVQLPDGVTLLNPTLASEMHLTSDQLQAAGSDPQLVQAIKDLAPAGALTP
ncbi:MAG TPA: S41 family peptidase [Ktedonobacterales bacterium]|nr:S41 family peptidase [Ktedonobacterales bacterium]